MRYLSLVTALVVRNRCSLGGYSFVDCARVVEAGVVGSMSDVGPARGRDVLIVQSSSSGRVQVERWKEYKTG